MAKAKNKRNSGLADKVNNKRKSAGVKKKLNPFEVHINKEKIKVLGKKSKHDRGLPGVSRAKAIQKRKETLGTELKLMNKTNTFIDRRIGEKNNQLSSEDRMIARFAAERVRQHSKKNLYNLADDEVLTHRGQTLEQIEKFDDPRSSDEEDEDAKKFGGLDNDFVSEGHFGGGILSRTDSKDGAKSHKDLIEQLIAESKKRKAEKQKEKEQTLDLTEKLDSEWKDLQPVVFKKARVEESAIEKLLSQAEKKGEDYDKMMRELRFEKRGTPSDGLKNVEKQAKEEKERIENLEREREFRMLDDEDEITLPTIKKTTGSKHRSADALDDNFELEDEKQFMLAYDKDGKPLVPENVLKDYSVPNGKPKFDDGISDTSSEDGDDESEENDDDEEEEEDDDDDDGLEKDNQNEAETKVTNGNQSDDDEESSDSEEEKEVNLKQDLKTNKSSNKDVDKKDLKDNTKSNSKVTGKETKAILFQNDDDDDDDKEESENEEESSESEDDSEESEKEDVDNLQDIRGSEEESANEEEMEEVTKKIGSFFDLKLKEGDNLKELLSGKTPTQQSQALQKLIKSYDPGLAENNKDLLSRLFAHMLQYVNDLFTGLHQDNIVQAFLIFDKLAPHFYDLAQTNKVSSKKFIVELLKEKHDNFIKKPKRVPDLDTLIFFKLVSLLYPTSDFQHPVTTPSLIFMSEILALSRFNDAYSISRGLFLTSLILEYTVLSKRLVPSAINFLRGILYLCANITILNPIQLVPPFKLHRDAKLLNLEDDCSKMAVQNKMAAKDLVTEDIDNDFKIRCLYTSVGMMKEYFDHFAELEVQGCLFEPHISLIGRIELDYYPKKVASKVKETVKYMKECLEVKTFAPLKKEQQKPKALRLYEPDVQEVFTGSKSGKLSREQAERARLQTRYKREMKGALREIRRDKAYVASVKIKERMHSDNIRKEKVKQIYKEASIQQGELNKLQRMK